MNPPRALDPLDRLDRYWTRFWRRWVVRHWGRWRDRYARCKVCGRAWVWGVHEPGTNPHRFTLPPRPPLCPECRSRYGGRGLTLGRMRVLETRAAKRIRDEERASE